MSQQIIIEEWKCRIAVNEASGPGWVVTNRCVMQKLAKIGLFFVVGALFLSPWTKFASHPFWYHSHSRIRIQHISSVYFLYQLCIYLVSFNKRQSLVFFRLRSPFFLSLSIYLSLYQLLFLSLPLYCRYKKMLDVFCAINWFVDATIPQHIHQTKHVCLHAHSLLCVRIHQFEILYKAMRTDRVYECDIGEIDRKKHCGTICTCLSSIEKTKQKGE